MGADTTAVTLGLDDGKGYSVCIGAAGSSSSFSGIAVLQAQSAARKRRQREAQRGFNT